MKIVGLGALLALQAAGLVRAADDCGGVLLDKLPVRTGEQLLRSAWKASDGEGGSLPIIGAISIMEQSESGEIVLFDLQQKQAIRIARNGSLIGQFGREGNGPGELSMPVWMSLTGDGVDFAESTPGRIVHFDLAGGGATTKNVSIGDGGGGEFVTLQKVDGFGNGYCAVGSYADMGGDMMDMQIVGFFGLLDGNAALKTCLTCVETSLLSIRQGDGIAKLQPLYESIWCTGDRLYLASDPSEFSIKCYDTDGNCEYELMKATEQVPYSAEEREELVANLGMPSSNLRALDLDPDQLVPRYKPQIAGMILRDRELWILLPKEAEFQSTEAVGGAEGSEHRMVFEVVSLADLPDLSGMRRETVVLEKVDDNARVFLLRYGYAALSAFDGEMALQYFPAPE